MPLWLVTLFSRYGYWALFVGVFLENLGIPVPGETVLLAAGFFSKQGTLRLSIVIPIAIVAAIFGDNFGYWIGRRGGRKFIDRYGRYVGLSAKRFAAVEEHFRKRGPHTIFTARFISGIRVVAALAAGATHVPWPTFLLYNAAGAIAWATTIGFLGFLFGQSWSLLEHWVGRAGLLLVGLVAAAILFAVLRRQRTRIASWITDWLPGSVTLYEAWLLAVSLLAIGLLGKITEDVVTREATPFDSAVSGWITSIDFSGIHIFMRIANALGSGPAIIGATIIAIGWRWYRDDRDSVAILTGLALVTQILDAVLKITVARVRPEPLHAYTRLYLASFPSGHAMNAVATYGFIAILIGRERPRLRHFLFITVAFISVLIGLARVYLQLHWPTDVLGGYCVGLLLLSVSVFWLDRLEPEHETT
jgi:membrane protein DedA with SNARE-associated domain/membrane-associated phospholipid phosphatase